MKKPTSTKYVQPKPSPLPSTYDGMDTPEVKKPTMTARGGGAAKKGLGFVKNG